MQLETGFDSRSSSWIFTSNRWAEAGVYIVLPVNPSSLEVSNPIRGIQGETQRGKFMYVHRNPISKSVIAPCNYTFEIPSGFILPQFNEYYIKEARDLAYEYAATMHNARTANPNIPSAGNAAASTAGIADQQAQRERITERKLSSFSARVSNYSNRIPGPDQVADYRFKSSINVSDYLSKSPTSPNIPALYVPDVPIGIQNFYAFIMLMDEPCIYTDAQGRIRNNRIIINFNTLELPSMTFWGWWDQGGLSFTEDVENHGEFNINFSIFVTASSPSLGYNNFASLMTNYKAEIQTTSATSLDRLQNILDSDDSKARKLNSHL